MFDENMAYLLDQDAQEEKAGKYAKVSPESILYGLDHSLEEVDEICRVCLGPGSIPIFGGEDDDDICEQLKDIAGIDVSGDDSLPQHICTQCRELLDSAIMFRSTAQNSDTALRSRTKRKYNDSLVSQCNRVSKTDKQSIEATECTESSDDENSEIGVYLECTDGDTASESESTASDIDASNASTRDCVRTPETLEPDSEEVKTLVDELNKNAQYLLCEICNITFRTIEQLNEHTSIHESKEIIKCEVCQNIINKDTYNVHLKLHRESYNQRVEKKYRKVDCTVCGKAISKSYIKKHMLLVHSTNQGNTTRYKICTLCDKPIRISYLSYHLKHVHASKETIEDEKSIDKLQCPICYRMCKESSYKDHVASHAAKRKKFICEECGKEFHSSSTFSTHLLTHKEEYKYECQFCPYKGKHLGLLKIHVRTHTKDYLYTCKICNASFITKSNLNAHEKTHTAGVKCVCSKCGKCFAAESTLRQHMVSVHDGIKAFACDVCGKSYGKKDVMMAHKKRVHRVPHVRQIGRKPSYLQSLQDGKDKDDL